MSIGISYPGVIASSRILYYEVKYKFHFQTDAFRSIWSGETTKLEETVSFLVVKIASVVYLPSEPYSVQYQSDIATRRKSILHGIPSVSGLVKNTSACELAEIALGHRIPCGH